MLAPERDEVVLYSTARRAIGVETTDTTINGKGRTEEETTLQEILKALTTALKRIFVHGVDLLCHNVHRSLGLLQRLHRSIYLGFWGLRYDFIIFFSKTVTGDDLELALDGKNTCLLSLELCDDGALLGNIFRKLRQLGLEFLKSLGHLS